MRRVGETLTYAPILAGTPVDPPPGAKPANFPGATTVPISGIVAGAVSCPPPDALQ